ncbi:MarR family winged helix-turn-helix transcriptional regulator [Streptomyces sp. AM6-12]|uniref:MarR family winged helix-turn-helix transcriptional regulator n=1 Tax=Streptomyces sp. AM6-12 TaxID=3345149 RepID=UPI003795A42B
MARAGGGRESGYEDAVSVVMAAARLVIGMSVRALAEVDDSLSLPQLRTLVALRECGPVKLASLAEVLGVNASTALRAVARLEEAGLADRRTNPESRREVVLTLTDHGSTLVDRVLGQRRLAMEKVVADVPAAARAGLVEGLRALLDAADGQLKAIRGAAEEFRGGLA